MSKLYITMALLAEAKPLIERLKMKKQDIKGLTLYTNDTTMLCITGIGRDNAFISTTKFLTLFPNTKEAVFLNLGVCGASTKYSVGQTLLAHTIEDTLSHKRVYPHLQFNHPFTEVPLTMVYEPATSDTYDVVDMESFAVCRVALQSFNTSQLLVIKVVSDHFSSHIPSKERVYEWISTPLDDILALCQSMQDNVNADDLQTEIESLKNALVEQLNLTKAQSDKLGDAFNYYRLRYKTLPVLSIVPGDIVHKNQRAKLLAKVIDELTS